MALGTEEVISKSNKIKIVLPGSHVTPVKSLYSESILHRPFLIGNVSFVYDRGITVPENAWWWLA